MALITHTEAGIDVVRAVFSKELMSELETECLDLLTTPRESTFFEREYEPIAPESPSTIHSRNYRLASLLNTGYVALQEVLETHPYIDDPEAPDANVIINHQQAGASQVFHPDFVAGIQVLVYASDDGVFDFEATYGSGEVESIDVNAGDMLTLNRPSVRHRGRNPSAHARVSLVFSSGGLFD